MTRSCSCTFTTCRTPANDARWFASLHSCTMLIVAATALLSGSPASADEDRVPEGLSASDWSSIRAVYEANRHAAFTVDDGYQARNPGQQWRTSFDGRGFTTTPDQSEWSWGLELVSYGIAGAECMASTPNCTESTGGRVSYQWDGTLTEWYINDQRGLEHGYTMHQRPDGTGPLHFTLAVRGGLTPQLNADKRNLVFADAAGAAVVNYSNLTVFDATGAIIPAWFELAAAPKNSTSQSFRIVVDDSNAVYPLTIDPLAQQAYLKASNTGADDRFGNSVAVDGNTVVVGAHQEDSNATGVNGNQANNTATDSGAAYVFVRSGTTWTQQAYLKASNTGADDLFGISVAISGNTIVVGAVYEDSNATGVNGNQANNSATNSGAAYVFTRLLSTWTQQAYLKASNTGTGDFYGYSVAISDNTVVVGARQEDSNATGVNGNQADNSAMNSGAAYVYVRSGSTWTQQAYLKASNTEEGDIFGLSVAISSNTVVVSAPNEDSNATGVNGNQANNSANVAGAAYVFVRSGTTWTQQAYLKASNTAANAWFGYSVAASGNTVVVGAAYEDTTAQNSGAAYVFTRTGTTWTQQAYLKASNPGLLDFFGWSVAISSNLVVVGARLEDSNATGINGNQADNSAADAGAAYVFARSGSTWTQRAYLKASNTGAGDEFGASVAIDGDFVVVGAPMEDSIATGINGNQASNSAADAGAAYVFVTIPCPADMNGDGVVNAADLGVVLGAWGSPACGGWLPCQPDLNNDGVVGPADLGALLGAWGTCW